MARDEAFPDEVGVDRRTFIKAAVGVGALGLTGALVVSGATLVPPAISQQGEVNEGFVFARGDTPDPWGYSGKAGQTAKPEDFQVLWSGAPTLWRALFDEDNNQIPGTGFPVLLIKVDPDLLLYPREWSASDFLPDEGIVAIWDRCVHLCCFPQWHGEKLPSAYQDYEAERVPRTFLAGQDPIWCRCHNSQYDPITLVWDVHPNGTVYIGANLVHGPATRALAAVSITDEGGEIVGNKFLEPAPKAPSAVEARLGGQSGKVFRDWYFAYCR